MSKRQRTEAPRSENRVELFFDRHFDTLEDLWEKVLHAIHVSDLPIFREDEPADGSAFNRFCHMLVSKFVNKVRVVSDDEESLPSESSSEEGEASVSMTEESSDEHIDLASDSSDEFSGESEEDPYGDASEDSYDEPSDEE